MATRRRKPWNLGLKMPGLLDEPPSPPPAPLSGKIEPGHSTPGAPPEQWECLRCERLRDGLEPGVPDHAQRCPFRGSGRDPDRGG